MTVPGYGDTGDTYGGFGGTYGDLGYPDFDGVSSIGFSGGMFGPNVLTNNPIPSGGQGILRWVFADGFSTYTWQVNPNSGGSPTFTRTLTKKPTTAPDGKAVVFDGGPGVPKGEFSGVLLSQQQYNDFLTWFGKNRAIQVIDDLGRVQDIWISQFSLKPAPRRLHPWRHTYTCQYVLLSPAVV